MAISWGDWVDIDADELSLTVTDTLKFLNIQDYKGSFLSAQVVGVQAVVSGCAEVNITNVGDEGVPEAVAALAGEAEYTAWHILVTVAQQELTDDHYWLISWDGGADEIDLGITVDVEKLNLQRRDGSVAPADRPARRASDQYAADRWLVEEDTQVRLRVTNVYDDDANLVTIDETKTFEEFVVGTVLTPGIMVYGELHDGSGDTTYLSQEIHCNAFETIFDGWDELFYGGKARAWGDGNTARWGMVEDYSPMSGSDSESATIHSSYTLREINMYCYRQVSLGLEALDDAMVTMLGVTATVEQWRAAAELIWQSTSWGNVSNWPYGGTPSGTLLQPEIQQTWAEEHDEDVDDLILIMDLGGAFWACQGSPYKEPITVAHVGDLDPMEPPGLGSRPADWVGGAGVDVTDDVFSIDGGTSAPQATWEVASNLEDRMDAYIADEEFPLGSGHKPTPADMYRQQKANMLDWEPDEQVRHWDDHATWRVDTTGPEGDIVLELYAPVLVVTDNCHTDGTRLTGFSYAWVDHYYYWTVSERGTTYLDLRLPDGYRTAAKSAAPYDSGSVMPDLRWVHEVTVEFPASAEAQEYTLTHELCGRDGHTPDVKHHMWMPTQGDDLRQPFSSSIVDGKPCARMLVQDQGYEEGRPYYVQLWGGAPEYDLDLGPAMTVEQVQGHWAACEGFEASLDQDVLDEMEYEGGDDEATRLYTACAYDAAYECFREESGIRFAMRVRGWYPPSLWPCDLHIRHMMRPNNWGWVRLGEEIGTEQVRLHSWRRETTEDRWEREGAGAPNDEGLITPPAVPGALRTGISVDTASEVYDTGVRDGREFYWTAWIGSRVGNPELTEDSTGRIWMVYESDGAIKCVVRASPQRDWEERTSVVETKHSHPSICVLSTGQIMVCATEVDGTTHMWASGDDGRHWGGGYMFLDDLQLGAITQMLDILVGVGYDEDDGYAYCKISDDRGLTAKTLRGGSTRAVIAPSDEAHPSVEVLGTEEILVCLTHDGKSKLYKSADFGEHWVAVDVVT